MSTIKLTLATSFLITVTSNALPQCFKDRLDSRDLVEQAFTAENLTLLSCRMACRRKNFRFAGVQNGTDCWCSYQYGKHGGASSSQCNVPCSGNTNENCGGVLRNWVMHSKDPVDGGWTQWGTWTTCSVTCGIGERFKERWCTNPPPAGSGMPCRGLAIAPASCNTGISCFLPQVNGVWSQWSQWSRCDVTCGNGITTRSRQCNSPAPSNGGRVCPGNDTEVMTCHLMSCPGDGGWSEWGNWGTCSVTCGGGTRSRSRLCNNPFPSSGGKPCGDFNTQADACGNGICPVHGGWSPWSAWAQCDVTCGQGLKWRMRECNNPPPSSNGKVCAGMNSDSANCRAAINCSVNGNWSSWSSWGSCSVTCDIGVTRRQRECNNPAPAFGGLTCRGESSDNRTCNTHQSCPVNGQWSTWVYSTPCDVTCGNGTRVRERVCGDPAPMFGGSNCSGDSAETVSCTYGIECPVNGNWSSWSLWEACSVTCGVGVTTRQRECNNPRPAFGGLTCRGEISANRTCSTQRNCPVSGRWSTWVYWTPCDVTCGNGTRVRERVCDDPAPMYGGSNCSGDSAEVESCTNGIYCPVRGQWSTWVYSTPCDVTCGNGTRVRERACDDPAPMYGGSNCSGDSAEFVSCTNGINCPVNGHWSSWAFSTPCDVTCGNGTRVRQRVCDDPAPMFGGFNCSGDSAEVLSCSNGINCPVNGNWSSWSLWGACSVTCDVGVTTRERECSNPVPAFGGLTCRGEIAENRTCSTQQKCPVNGHWSSWVYSTPCDVTCGNGSRVRQRSCDDPAPMFGGSNCSGDSVEIVSCSDRIGCPVNGQWSSWLYSSPCDVTCGNGSRVRQRSCDDPAPMFGGSNCSGDSVEVVSCSARIGCPVNGQWSSWVYSFTCDVTCGNGSRVRQRYCDDPAPMFGGSNCSGDSVEVVSCSDRIGCPVNGQWSSWVYSTTCDVTCGNGSRVRQRSCDDPAPMFGGSNCSGDSVEVVSCSARIGCPVNGNWSNWSSWGACSVTCDVGLTTRQRHCNSPLPAFGGLTCHGKSLQNRTCSVQQNCSIAKASPVPVNGQWSSWTYSTPCDVTCGNGTRVRQRACDDPAPVFGGSNCSGDSVEVVKCSNRIGCPVNGNWSNWSSWGVCSVTCDVGLSARQRECNSPVPAFGGLTCHGKKLQNRTCSLQQNCPSAKTFPVSVNGQWSTWVYSTPCDVTCGNGTRVRERVCGDPAPMFGGFNCSGDSAETVSCTHGIECPVNGNWSSWSSWGTCSVTCEVGVSVRERNCNNPVPAFGGLSCVGRASENRTCNTQQVCLVNGHWSSWVYSTPCDVTCGSGTRVRERTCDDPAPMFGGSNCSGDSAEVVSCTNGIVCPAGGEDTGNMWSKWSHWSACSATCGLTYRSRTRVCNAPTGLDVDCNGSDLDYEVCTLQRCSATKDVKTQNVDWSVWSEWTSCSVTCGNGIKWRRRTCPRNDGQPCRGHSNETQDCSNRECVIDGAWSAWGSWSSCAQTCGNSTHERSRRCNNPSPAHGGSSCKGRTKDYKVCTYSACTRVDGNWSDWGSWSTCALTCGSSTQERSRRCDNPSPANGGSSCDGRKIDYKVCDNLPCSQVTASIGDPIVNGAWSDWGPWSTCARTCGASTHERSRRCDNPSPANGGSSCEGRKVDYKLCRNSPCPRDGEWSRWSEWNRCNVTCGSGVRSRRRWCDDPTPSDQGADCEGPPLETRQCASDVCPGDNTIGDEVDEDEGWATWLEWSACVDTCGTSHRYRTRECLNLQAQDGAEMCAGSSLDYNICQLEQCPKEDGRWSSWTAWTNCNATCGAASRWRRRQCNLPEPSNGGKPCDGNAVDNRKCDNIDCPLDTDPEEPVNGSWSTWSEWGACNVLCGFGFHLRKRTCDNPPPMYDGLKCRGPEVDRRYCERGPCPVHGGWTCWSNWERCSVSCGQGIKSRERNCSRPRPAYSGRTCSGHPRETAMCNAGVSCSSEDETQLDDTDYIDSGKWSDWSSWSSCEQLCNVEANRTRSRRCKNTDVTKCVGDDKQVKLCPFKACPLEELVIWGSFGPCNVTCGGGLRYRNSTCSVKGRPWPCNKTESYFACNTNTCPSVDGNWSEWMRWSRCNKATNQEIRSRTCTNPAPKNGGLPCVGWPTLFRRCEEITFAKAKAKETEESKKTAENISSAPTAITISAMVVVPIVLIGTGGLFLWLLTRYTKKIQLGENADPNGATLRVAGYSKSAARETEDIVSSTEMISDISDNRSATTVLTASDVSADSPTSASDATSMASRTSDGLTEMRPPSAVPLR